MSDITELPEAAFVPFFSINPLEREINGKSRNILMINTYPSRNPLQSVYLNKLLQELLVSFLWGTCSSCINLLPSTKAVCSETGLKQTLDVQSSFFT